MPNPVDLQGRSLFDVEGDEIGVIEGVYLDNATRVPEWAAVRLGPDALALVPLTEASMVSGDVQVDYERDMVLAAPHRLTGLDTQVTETTEEDLYRYYRGGDGGVDDHGVASAAETGKAAAAEVKDQAVEVAATAGEQAAEVAAEAKEQAVDVVTGAKEQALSVVETARDEVIDVAHQASAEAAELYETTKTELQEQAETQLEQLAETLHRLAGQALALARGNAEQSGQVGELVGRAGRELRSVARSIDAKGSPGLLGDAQRVVRQRPRAAIIGTAAAVVAGARLMGTPAGERLKEKLGPLKDQAIEAGRSVAEELKPVAQQRVENVKAAATQAAEQVKQDAQGTTEDVKATTRQAGKTVKGTTKRSVTEVKGTAKRSSATARATVRPSATAPRAPARRTGRPAAPMV